MRTKIEALETKVEDLQIAEIKNSDSISQLTESRNEVKALQQILKTKERDLDLYKNQVSDLSRIICGLTNDIERQKNQNENLKVSLESMA